MENEDSLDALAYTFISLIKVSPISWHNEELMGSVSHVPSKDWSDYIVRQPTISREPSPDNNRPKISVEFDYSYGFADDTYPALFDMLKKISGLTYFKNTVSLDFIEDNAIFWLYDAYKKATATTALLTYLKIKAEENIEERTYYFPILNLHIYNDILIGDVNITFFTKDYFDRLQERNSKMDNDVFDKLYRKFQGGVFASYSILAEEQKGTEIAFEKCSRAIDVLKLFSPTVFFPDKKNHMGLAEKININYQADYLLIPKKDLYAPKVNSSAKNDPFIINQTLYDNVISKRLSIFSNQLLKLPTDELSNLIIQSIQLFSYALSTFDLHLRITHIITIFESLLLEEERQHKLQQNVTARLIKLFNDANISTLLADIYTIRHKMIHKAIKLEIELLKLKDLQLLMVNTLMRVCVLNQSLKTKKDLIDHLTQL